MEGRRVAQGWVLRLDPGEEIVGVLGAWATRENVRSGLVSGIGAVGETELGFFVRETRDYVRRRFTGEYEIAALTGNLSERDGVPFAHLHLVIADEDFVARAGHLFRAVVTVTCEIQVVTDGAVVRRIERPELGVYTLELDGQ